MDPNKGFGRPGSLQFHKLSIFSCETVKDVNEYVKQVVGKPITLRHIQDLAIHILEEYLNGDS